MKVAAVDTFVLTVPTPQPMAKQYPLQKLVCAEISTDAELVGLGYSLVFGGGGAEAVQAYLERLKPLLVGADPLFVETLWEKMTTLPDALKSREASRFPWRQAKTTTRAGSSAS